MDHIENRLLADRVAASIARAGLSKASVASAAGIPRSTFSRKLDGHTEFTFGELLRIAHSVGVNPADYLPDAFRTPTRAA